MRIGIIGAGNIGGTVAALLTHAGHEVALSNSRGPDSLRDEVARLGPSARAATIDEAAAFGGVVLLAIPFHRYRELPADALAGRVVVDATNYFPDRDGHIAALDAGETTSSELIAAHLAGARLVKAFNALYYVHLRDDGRPLGAPDCLALPLAGDDAGAKRIVAQLIDQIGFDPVDTGSLAEGGRRQQPGAALIERPRTAAEARAVLAEG